MALQQIKSGVFLLALCSTGPLLDHISSTGNYDTREIRLLNDEKANHVKKEFLNEEEVNFYLAKYRGISSLLEEAYRYIANIFPKEITIVLEIFNFADEYQDILSVNIKSDHLEYDELLAYLDKFEREWWLLNIQKANQKLTFNV